MHTIQPDFGKRLAGLRARREMSLTELAERSGVFRNYCWRLEQGEQEPRAGVVVSLARALGVKLTELIPDPIKQTA